MWHGQSCPCVVGGTPTLRLGHDCPSHACSTDKPVRAMLGHDCPSHAY
ncbi:MAG: hypothetical protein NZ874_06175 [Fimbriimonadales bacterium]|nr:hypothetical protein [Fimbriimonadales bacterium]